MRRWMRLLVTLGLVLGGFVACGGGDDDDSSSASANDKPDTESAEDAGDAAANAADFAGFDEDCQDAVAAMSSVAAGASAAFGGGGTDISDSIETFRQFADRAPDEIKDEMQLMAKAYGDFVEALGDYDPSSGEAPPQEVMDAIAKLDNDELSAASEKVSSYFEEHCGTDIGD